MPTLEENGTFDGGQNEIKIKDTSKKEETYYYYTSKNNYTKPLTETGEEYKWN